MQAVDGKQEINLEWPNCIATSKLILLLEKSGVMPPRKTLKFMLEEMQFHSILSQFWFAQYSYQIKLQS